MCGCVGYEDPPALSLLDSTYQVTALFQYLLIAHIVCLIYHISNLPYIERRVKILE